MLENYLKLLAIGDCVRNWRNGNKVPRGNGEIMTLLSLLGFGFACVGYQSTDFPAIISYVFSAACFIHPILWLIRPNPAWDLACGRLLEHYKPIDVVAFVKLKKDILTHDGMRLEDIETWLIKEMAASTGVAEVAGSKAGEKYPFLYDTPVTGRGRNDGN